jgi:hypothetical protein
VARSSAISRLEKRVTELEARILEARIAELEPSRREVSRAARRFGFSAGDNCTFACTEDCTHSCTTCCAGEVAAKQPG